MRAIAILRTVMGGLLLTALTALTVAPAGAASPEYPKRPVTIVVPFPPGGPSDSYVRLMAQRLQERLDQPFIVENRPGATGAIGSALVARAQPDGYTLLFASNSSQIIAPLLRAQPPYDGVEDFEPIALLGRYPFALIVNNDVPARNVQELVALAKTKPDGIFFGSIGEGSGTHLMAELFQKKAGVKLVHVPYKGGSAVNTALMSGEIQLYFDGVGSARTFVEAGRSRALAVSGARRSQLMPQVPTLRESGLDGFDPTIWLGLFAPRGTPRAITQALYREVRDVLDTDTDLQARFADAGIEILGTSSEKMPVLLREEQAQWKALIDGLSIRPQ